MISITLKQNINATRQQICETLLEHQQLSRFFDATFSLIQPQNKTELKGGKGAIRQVKISGITFSERIISADHHHISYQIIGNKPVAEHRGNIHFNENDLAKDSNIPASTEVTYHISCKAPWWLPSLILAFFIKKDLGQALKKLASHFPGEIVCP
ncbi:SRPBCC family protein [Colwellia hornerae]|uniref:SRPBCC family protein n=1 Tax=Colwellia hornerae TaxID=89402 RepID=A0A5C6QMD7_9GAMM|nr:SRPBCC family protein [Colwellia hornerae]TWX53708.1 SRPBCC family protein [Colwellia hornerae]TWX60358.1 SRPBCC family protein [Colwellia hornerae]TWX70114.1 SRPBCC family protein [Colwellia hornerae]